MRPAKALEKLSQDPKHEEARAAAAKLLRSLRALRLNEDGTIDAGKTLVAVEHCEETGEAGVPGGITLSEWLESRRPQKEACPLTRRALFEGKVQVDRQGLPPMVLDYNGITPEQRLLMGYVAETDSKEGDSFLRTVHRMVRDGSLERDYGAEWAQVQASSKPLDKALAERVRARVVFQDAPAAAPPPAPPPVPAVSSAGAIPSAPAFSAPLFVVQGSLAAFQQMEPYLRVAIIQGEMRVWHESMVPTGSNVYRTVAEHLGRAAVVVHLLEAGYDPDAAFAWAPSGARHIPVRYRPCAVLPILESKASIPRDGRWINQASDRGDAWYLVAEELRAVARKLR